MKALILAAGLGTRLAPLTDDRPKSLVTVNGKPILFQQIDSLVSCGIEDIVVVAGYRADVLREAVRSTYRDAVRIVENANYATTNNMYSAWLGMGGFEGEPFLMMNADVYLDESVVSSLLAFGAPNAIVVDEGRWMEESMKVAEDGGRLTDISKEIPPERALGCSIDVYKFGVDGGNAFREMCELWIVGRGVLDKWSEVALRDALSVADFRACPLDGRWLEIDNLDDLAEAERLFR